MCGKKMKKKKKKHLETCSVSSGVSNINPPIGLNPLEK